MESKSKLFNYNAKSLKFVPAEKMSSVRLEVMWSPVHKDKFITWGTEIFLYETFENFVDKRRADGNESARQLYLDHLIFLTYLLVTLDQVDCKATYKLRVIIQVESNISDIELSENSGARLLATNSSYHYVKCLDIYPLKGSEILLAIGQANGKVSLTSFGPSSYDCLGINGMDLSK